MDLVCFRCRQRMKNLPLSPASAMREKDLPGHLPGESEKAGEKKDGESGGAPSGAAQGTAGDEKSDAQLDRAVEYLKDSFLNKKDA